MGICHFLKPTQQFMLLYIMDLEALSSCPQTNKRERERERERKAPTNNKNLLIERPKLSIIDL